MAAPAPQPDVSISRMAAQSVLGLAVRFHQTELDCSHFVHYVFQQTGLKFDYAPSRELFAGVPEFKRVIRPRAGDLIVWRGHVGIVVDPFEHTFLSRLNSGVKIARYDSSYWRKRGVYRFLRYSGPSTEESEQGE